MPKVSVYIRPTTGNRTPKKATSGSTGPFYLRYELNGKRIWESLTTRTYTFALADARSKESSLLREEATPPKPSPVAPKSVEELRAAFIHDKRTSRKKNGELRPTCSCGRTSGIRSSALAARNQGRGGGAVIEDRPAKAPKNLTSRRKAGTGPCHLSFAG